MASFPETAFAAVLVLSAITSAVLVQRARPAARAYIRFAAALWSAFAVVDIIAAQSGVAGLSPFATTMAPLICAPGGVALALAVHAAFESPPHSAFAASAPVLATVAGLTAAPTGALFTAFTALFAAVCAILVLGLREWRNDWISALHALGGAGALFAAFVTGGNEGCAAFALFSSVGLLGLTLAATKSSQSLVHNKAKMRLNGARISAGD